MTRLDADGLNVFPMTFRRACDIIEDYHRHNKPPRGMRAAIGLRAGSQEYGVAVLGRPTSREYDVEVTAEVTRLCVVDNAPLGSCSKLYRACWGMWKAWGGSHLITYTLQSESGASLRGAGFVMEALLEARREDEWMNRGNGRVRQDVIGQAKIRWGIKR